MTRLHCSYLVKLLGQTTAYNCCCAGERHGTPAERLLAAQRRANLSEKSRPHTLFATGPKQQPQHIPEGQQGGYGGEAAAAGMVL